MILPHISFAESDELTDEEIKNMRMALYQKAEAISQIPWYYYAAIDQYERNIHDEYASNTGIIGITFPKEMWNGITNPNLNDKQHQTSTGLFNGKGADGDGDNITDRTNDEDIIQAMVNWMTQQGLSKQDLKIALWKYFKRELSVQTIMNMAKVYKAFQTLELENNAFPLPKGYNYSYRNTWGDPRGFGGRRIHEGTDIFANYGVPVRSTSYGVVELKGWNRYGGWRIGIRDIHNIYHYYAHLNGYEKDIKVGKVVKPGDVIGYVGATGYGPKGTSGKFPPHLHYGMYKDNGETEYSFDPYPYLRRAEANH
ncbi:Murein DD-endopeptidase MepM and murein hydrolase activator NlpD, contain LysM domain [Salinibacillus kushneri]|uniref:Murein DD-endopeptidase MepM and murein hydrolase activator NlpD, contain LysM domain n=1 Tax=Salinibacillus kushneri TaxID=237682 RepID=A0A1H9YAQ7_9BACI|nr:Murein DD-endopeptidase MepM and murein hydrolase activator NlpD, contain LysM domain [Salinibacillus kushneri]